MQRKIKPEFVISIIALIVAIATAFASIYFSRINIRTSVLPVLVLVYEDGKGWEVRNVGNGPALNVTIAHQLHNSSKWESPTRMYPISEGQMIEVPWVKINPDKIAVVYSDVHDNEYTSITDDDLTKINRGRKLPVWEQSRLNRVWDYL